MAGISRQFSDLYENIEGSVDGLFGSGQSTLPKAPTSIDTDSIIEASSWQKLPFPYTFSVQNIKTGKISNDFTDFALPLAPESISQTEDFAFIIDPTQGGTTVNHSGTRYKTLTIKGTTGVHAFRGAGGVQKSTGEAIFQPKTLKYKSGYEVFLRLRNWFRAYYEFKKISPFTAKDLRLVFKNFKDGEFLIVECTKFVMQRQAARPFLYDYDLEFKVLSHFRDTELEDFLQPEGDLWGDAQEMLDLAQGVLLRGGDILRQVEGIVDSTILSPLRKINLILKTAIALPTVAADIGKRIYNETVSAVNAIGITLGITEEQRENRTTGSLDPRIAAIETPKNVEAVIAAEGSEFISSFGEGLMALGTSRFPKATQEALAEEQAVLQNTPRSFYEDFRGELLRVRQNAEDFFNLGDSTLDTLLGRDSTLNADPTKIVTTEEFEILYAMNLAVQAIDLILSTEGLFKSSYSDRLDVLTKDFDDFKLTSTNVVEQKVYEAGDTLERLAQKHLGDYTRWGEIAELNQLLAPYVVVELDSTLVGVLKPGDRFLIPSVSRNGFSPLPKGKVTAISESLSEVEKALGIDFRLDENFDLVLTPSNDIALISSIDNLVQAISLKLGYEKGELLRFPNLGASVNPGVKFPALVEIRENVISTLLQDPRVERVEDLELVRKGSELQLTFDLKIKQIDLKIPLTIKLN